VKQLYGDSVPLSRVTWDHVHVYLMPDGEEVTSAGETEYHILDIKWFRRVALVDISRKVHASYFTSQRLCF